MMPAPVFEHGASDGQAPFDTLAIADIGEGRLDLPRDRPGDSIGGLRRVQRPLARDEGHGRARRALPAAPR